MCVMIRLQASVLTGLSLSVLIGAQLLPMNHALGQAVQSRRAELLAQARSNRRPTPPRKGRYVPIRGGGSRGCGDNMRPLVPTEQKENHRFTTGGFTVSERPDFWVHVPHTADEVEAIEFVLESEQGELVYETSLQAPQSPGLIQIKFPETAPPLKVDTSYRWVVAAELRCPTLAQSGNSGATQSSLDQSDGWLTRYAPDTEMTQMLQKQSQKSYQIYRDSGVWFDAANQLAQQLKANPSNEQLRQEWVELMALYGLDAFASEPFAEDCCEPVEGSLLVGEK